MNEKLNINDIVELLSAKKQLSKSETERFLKTFFTLFDETLVAEKCLSLDNYGIFSVEKIHDDENAETAAYMQLTFAPDNALLTLINKPFAHFHPTLLNDAVQFENVPEVIETDSEVEEFHCIETIHFDEPDTQADKLTISEEKNDDRTAAQNKPIAPTATIGGVENAESQPRNVAETAPEIHHEAEPVTHVASTTIATEEQTISKNTRPGLWILLLSLLVVVAACLFFYLQLKQQNRTLHTKTEIETTPLQDKSMQKPLQNTAQETSPATHSAKAEKIEKATLKRGQTLRLLALEKYGHRNFWVYIYYENKDHIDNPDLLPVGFEVVLPDAAKYAIDANNPESVEKAKQLGDEVMKTFW